MPPTPRMKMPRPYEFEWYRDGRGRETIYAPDSGFKQHIAFVEGSKTAHTCLRALSPFA